MDEAAAVIEQMRGGLLTDEDVRYLDERYVPKMPVSNAW